MTDKIKVVWCPIKLGIDLVVLDLAYYVIGLKTQCLCTQGHLTQIFPTFPNTIVNLDFYMKTDSGLSWVSNDR